jgi:hypothetical protein
MHNECSRAMSSYSTVEAQGNSECTKDEFFESMLEQVTQTRIPLAPAKYRKLTKGITGTCSLNGS